MVIEWLEILSFGYTDEFQDSYIKLIYLRSRFLSPETGRFQTRDTWQGDYNRPGSLNRWNYVEGNVVNLTDPSGFKPRPPDGPRGTGGYACAYDPSANIDIVEARVSLSKSDWLNTYTVAGLAVQCWAEQLDGSPENPYPRPNGVNDSWGPAQVSVEQTQMPYGTGGEKKNLGTNLRCYVLKGDPRVTGCFTEDEIKDCPDISRMFEPESPLDPHSWHDAATLMKRRIQHAIDTCKDKNTGKDTCGNTDKYIIASMAQNAGSFAGMDGSLKKYKERAQLGEVTPTGVVYFWQDHFEGNEWKNAGQQLGRFKDAVDAFERRGWAVPDDIPSDYIIKLINLKHWWTP